MSGRTELEFMPCNIAPFMRSTATWPGIAAGLYWMLLMHQWQNGFIPESCEDAAMLLRVPEADLCRHWARISAKFDVREVDGEWVRVNLRCEQVFVEQEARFRKTVERNRANGAKGGRPKHPHEENNKPTGLPSGEPNGNPAGNPVGTPVATTVATHSQPTGNPEKTKNKNKNKKDNSVSKDTADESPGRAPTIEGIDVSTPFGKCYSVLWGLAERTETDPPPYSDAVKHLSGNTGLLKLANEVGIEESVELILWVWKHKGMGLAYSVIADHWRMFLMQKGEGVKFVRIPVEAPKAGLVRDIESNPFRDE